MDRFRQSMQEMLGRLADHFGIRASDNRRLEMVREKLESEKRRYADQIDDLKDQIGRLERLALSKKREMDAARGEGKRIIGREIEQTLRERGMLREKETLLFSRKEKVTLLLRKMELAAPSQAASRIDLEEVADEAALLMDDLVSTEKAADRAVADLHKIRYEEPARDQVDLEAELGRASGRSEEAYRLSDDVLDELAELEPPEEEQ